MILEWKGRTWKGGYYYHLSYIYICIYTLGLETEGSGSGTCFRIFLFIQLSWLGGKEQRGREGEMEGGMDGLTDWWWRRKKYTLVKEGGGKDGRDNRGSSSKYTKRSSEGKGKNNGGFVGKRGQERGEERRECGTAISMDRKKKKKRELTKSNESMLLIYLFTIPFFTLTINQMSTLIRFLHTYLYTYLSTSLPIY
ncbi:hypothetical protein F4809DRAFT_515594 [Biscogniauxia mediterranea]|nr:hypothetical protein F4809DRAFT_515594 [Biscogniauxia mediterranea]